MGAHNVQSLVSRYLDAAGQAKSERYHLAIDELVWLVNHSTHINELRLGLLRELQAALPRSQEGDVVSELKELLTNLIIMQTRLADRGEKFSELLRQLAETRLLGSVAVDEASLREGIQAVGEALEHLQSVAGSMT